MKHFSKVIKLSVLFFVFLTLLTFSVSAKNEVYEKLCNNKGGIMSVSHRGDAVSYPENSLEAVLSASKKGADMVSVSVQKSADGVFVLCEKGDLSSFCSTKETNLSKLDYKALSKISYYETDGSVSKCKITSLEKALKALRGKSILVLDNAWEYRNELEEFARENQAFQNIILRTDEKSKNIKKWKEETNSSLNVLGIYDGGIIFFALSHISNLKDESVVQYQSKNYFNEMYKSLVTRNFSNENNPRALSPMYHADLCGQRTDCDTGWNEMINRGFSVIETNCIEELVYYIERTEKVRDALQKLCEKGEKVDISLYSSASEKNFSKAFVEAKEILKNPNTSLEKLQGSYSLLSQTMKNLTFGTHEDDQRGNLNVTPLKVFFVIVFGSLILLGEIYVYKKQKRKLKG